MQPHEDPAQPADAEANEGLEHWLRDLRTEPQSDPFHRPADPVEAPVAPEEGRRGRHRAED